MQSIIINIFQMPSGKYKIRFWGQPNDHVSDWRGCNYHALTVPKQPVQGFSTLQELETWWDNHAWTKNEAIEYCCSRQGTHLPESDNGPMGTMLNSPYIFWKKDPEYV